MFSIPKRFHVIFLAEVLLCIGALLVISWHFDVKERQLPLRLDEAVASKRAHVLVAAGVADRGGAGEGAEDIIADCTSRNQFEDLLGRLHLLSHADLVRVSSLFDACGDYFATRKSVGVMLFDTEVQSFEELIALRYRVTNDDPYTKTVRIWRDILDLERKRAALLREQVTLQRDIIAELLADGSARIINERMSRAGQVSELFAVYDKQIDALRAEEAKVWAEIER